jgi:hypothetical protein
VETRPAASAPALSRVLIVTASVLLKWGAICRLSEQIIRQNNLDDGRVCLEENDLFDSAFAERITVMAMKIPFTGRE